MIAAKHDFRWNKEIKMTKSIIDEKAQGLNVLVKYAIKVQDQANECAGLAKGVVDAIVGPEPEEVKVVKGDSSQLVPQPLPQSVYGQILQALDGIECALCSITEYIERL